MPKLFALRKTTKVRRLCSGVFFFLFLALGSTPAYLCASTRAHPDSRPDTSSGISPVVSSDGFSDTFSDAFSDANLSSATNGSRDVSLGHAVNHGGEADAQVKPVAVDCDEIDNTTAVPAAPSSAGVKANQIALNHGALNQTKPEEASSNNVLYESVVVAKKGSEMLALYNTLSDPVDKESLDALARHCYKQMNGSLYNKFLVNWYLPGQSKGDKPWAVSNFADGKEVVEILNEEMVKKFPSVKRWQQPGHDPLP